MDRSDIMINGGYFVFKRSIFDYIKEGEELVQEPFHRLIETNNLVGYAYDGFWKSVDTFKEKQELDELYSKGTAPGSFGSGRAKSRPGWPGAARPQSDDAGDSAELFTA